MCFSASYVCVLGVVAVSQGSSSENPGTTLITHVMPPVLETPSQSLPKFSDEHRDCFETWNSESLK